MFLNKYGAIIECIIHYATLSTKSILIHFCIGFFLKVKPTNHVSSFVM